jgi:hypothetical protein
MRLPPCINAGFLEPAKATENHLRRHEDEQKLLIFEFDGDASNSVPHCLQDFLTHTENLFPLFDGGNCFGFGCVRFWISFQHFKLQHIAFWEREGITMNRTPQLKHVFSTLPPFQFPFRAPALLLTAVPVCNSCA